MTLYERAPEVTAEHDGQRIFVQPASTGSQWIVLEGTAAALWNALENPSQSGALATRLAERYQAEPAVIRRDLEDVLSEWTDRGLVVSRG